MTGKIAIDIPQSAAVPASTRRALLEAAWTAKPSAHIRARLATERNMADRFDETLALFEGADLTALTVTEARAFAFAAMVRRDADDIARADIALTHALDSATEAPTRAGLLAEQAKCALLRGYANRSVALLDTALTIDPHNTDAFKRRVLPLLLDGDVNAVQALVARLSAQGVRHSRLLAAHMVATARGGDGASAVDLSALDFALSARPLATPADWPDGNAFLAELTRDLVEAVDRRTGRHGTASVDTVRIDDVTAVPGRAAAALCAAIADAAADHAASLSTYRHPWVDARPDRARLSIWCVITRANGHEGWHTHPQGWMSGGFYAAVPATVADGSDPAGCLEFGLPDGITSPAGAAAFGTRLVRPSPGLLTLFPSHTYHRTHPHGTDGVRVCVAFDLIPA